MTGRYEPGRERAVQVRGQDRAADGDAERLADLPAGRGESRGRDAGLVGRACPRPRCW